ncbi:hypothetical protein R3P38DRAFT_3524462 [Favolaschia claudopus]|uniref:Uncharacterized protein n=1 Tax=Favolaschia claudopus TaxID=2862362 RepID=A0AAW0BKV3_9AGAR
MSTSDTSSATSYLRSDAPAAAALPPSLTTPSSTWEKPFSSSRTIWPRPRHIAHRRTPSVCKRRRGPALHQRPHDRSACAHDTRVVTRALRRFLRARFWIWEERERIGRAGIRWRNCRNSAAVSDAFQRRTPSHPSEVEAQPDRSRCRERRHLCPRFRTVFYIGRPPSLNDVEARVDETPPAGIFEARESDEMGVRELEEIGGGVARKRTDRKGGACWSHAFNTSVFRRRRGPVRPPNYWRYRYPQRVGNSRPGTIPGGAVTIATDGALGSAPSSDDASVRHAKTTYVVSLDEYESNVLLHSHQRSGMPSV